MYIPSPGSFKMTLREHVANTGQLNYEEPKSGTRAALIDEVFDFHNHHLSYARFGNLEEAFPFPQSKTPEDAERVVKDLRTMLFYQTAVEAYLFGYLKFFDPTLSPDDPNNFYMEREWRVAGKVRFGLTDIEHVFVSPGLADQARRDFPELSNRVVSLTVGGR